MRFYHRQISLHLLPEFAGSGCVELDEFVELVAPTLKDQKTQEQDLRDAFKVFDKNGNIFKYPHSL